jgi:hypothetical protein
MRLGGEPPFAGDPRGACGATLGWWRRELLGYASPQPLEADLLVAVLAALSTADDHDAGRAVHEPHG